MHPQCPRKLLVFFNLCGYHTRFEYFTLQPKCIFLIFALHIIYASIITYVLYVYLNDKLAIVDDKLVISNDVLKLGVLILDYWSSVIESYTKLNIQNKFWDCVAEIDQKFGDGGFNFSNFKIQFRLYFGLKILLDGVYFKRVIFRNGGRFLYFWFIYVSLTMIFTIRSFYYLFHLEFIKHELQVIVFKSSEMSSDRKNRNQPKWIRHYYDLVCDMSDTINTLFAWSNTVTIILPFHVILVDLNWFYWKQLQKYHFNSLGEISLFGEF